MRAPRFTTRRLMILVALVALLAAGADTLDRRRQRFMAEFQRHALWVRVQDIRDFQGRGVTRTRTPPGYAWREMMARKYAQAARCPWLPVAPDPPMQ